MTHEPVPPPVPVPPCVPDSEPVVRRHVFEYALLRVVPRVERGESMNGGVVVYCRGLDYLGCRVHLDADRLETASCYLGIFPY